MHKKHSLKCKIIAILMLILIHQSAIAQCNSDQKSKFADRGKRYMPWLALGVSLSQKDYKGALYSQVMTHGLYRLNQPLERSIHKKRPCGCDGSFPSGHMMMMASSASFLYHRYGWEVGLPAYALAFGLAADRVKAKAHKWEDMVGTALIMHAVGYVFINKFEDKPVAPFIAIPEDGKVQAGIKVNI